MNLRTRVILAFIAATLVPLASMWYLGNSLLEHSLTYAGTDQLDRLSRTLEKTGRELYQSQCDLLRNDAALGRIAPRIYPVSGAGHWPGDVREFWDSGEPERFSVSDDGGNRLMYMHRAKNEVRWYAKPLDVNMAQLASEFRRARETVERDRARDLRRGFLLTFALLASVVWAISLAIVILMAHRMTRPIRSLTEALRRLAAGDTGTRVDTGRTDELGLAMTAFNEMAGQLQHSRERIIYLAQMNSWQLLARKMAHELKNSLTPIRLTVEEILARRDGAAEDGFLAQAARIVIDEVESLERRVRAFSQFASEPPVNPVALDVNAAVSERIEFLKNGHAGLSYSLELCAESCVARADSDLVNGILTNLLENAAEAAGGAGRILVSTGSREGTVTVEVHDSGPGLSEEAQRSLFEPTISFKKGGMGLGLSIARKNALLMSGDLEAIPGALGGAAFRLTLPAVPVRAAARA